VERLARDKHSSLLQKFVTYGHFISLAPANEFATEALFGDAISNGR